MTHKLFLLDGMALAYRAYYALYTRPRINSKGINTSSVYGFTMTLVKLINDYGMEHAAVVMDADAKTFRHEMFPAYKGTREPPPKEIISNLPLIKEVVLSLDLPLLEVLGVEADDVIGTLACKAENEGHEAIIVSSDKDFQQLLSPKVSIYKPKGRGQGFDHITEESFREKVQISPSQFIDALALMGDKVDNVPGIRGIGPKTAMKLLRTYGTLEVLLEKASTIKGKVAREGLMSGAEAVKLSKELVTIKLDVDVSLDWDAVRCAAPNNPKTASVLRRLEFASLLGRLGPVEQLHLDGIVAEETAKRKYDATSVDYHLIKTREELVVLERTLARQQMLSWHAVHAQEPPVWTDRLGLAVAWAEATARYIPLPLLDGTPESEVIRMLAPVFTNPNVAKVGHGIKPLLVLLGRRGVQMAGDVFDTEVAHYLLEPDINHGLDFVARERLRYECVEWDDKRSPWDADDVTLMACERADLALRLRGLLYSALESKGLREIATEMEFPLIYSLAEMEKTGVTIDPAVLSETEKKVAGEVAKLAKGIYDIAGREFNIASPAKVGDILFGKMNLPVRHKTASGKPSTRESVLIELATEHKICGMILDWRKLTRLLSTYVAGLRRWIYPGTGRVHTVFNQTSAATGRLSSSDPGLQNIPIRRATGRELRRAFVAPASWSLLSADYSQIELRILAHMSGDDRLLEIFRAGRDPHTETAAQVHGVDADQVSPEQRNKAKAVNYGIPYGVSATGLAQQLRCSTREARDLVKAHRQSFPGVHRFLSRQVEEARAHGYARTLLGRRRYLPDLNAGNRAVRSAAERIAVNMPIQGTQADMIKLAMVVIHDRIKKLGLSTRMLLQVHDELVFEVPHYEEAEVKEMVHDAMVNALTLTVPVEVNLDTGPTWLDAH